MLKPVIARDRRERGDPDMELDCFVAFAPRNDGLYDTNLMSGFNMIVGIPKEIKTDEYRVSRENGGCGILLGGVPGVDLGHVVIVGGGIVGAKAAERVVHQSSGATV